MQHKEWGRLLRGLAEEFKAELVDNGRRYQFKLPNGASVWCAKTPSHPAPDRVKGDIRRALASSPRAR
jgi:hypothetical protein